MSKLSDLETRQPVKMLLIGDSGTGKTGSLAALAQAGYKLRILDYDKGVQPIYEALKKANRLDAMDNVYFQTMSDKMQVVGANVIPRGVPTAISEGLKMLEYWGPKSCKGADDLGAPYKWGLDCVLVIDSLTHLCNAAMRYVQTANGNAGKNPTQPEWGNAQRIVEQMLELLHSEEFNTNVIVTSHVTYIQSDNTLDDDGNPSGPVKGLPTALGRALPPKIPSYFNIMLGVEVRGTGAFAKRKIVTVPSGNIPIKNPILSGIPAELPLETGLATYFDAVLGKAKADGPSSAQPLVNKGDSK